MWILTRYALVFATLTFGPTGTALAWSTDPPPAPDRQMVSAQAKAVDLGRESEARIIKEIEGFRRLSAHVRIDLPAGTQGLIYVFGEGGLLKEVVASDRITDNAFWTEVVEGNELILSLVLPGQTDAVISIDEVAGEKTAGVPDGAPDGRFDLDLVEAGSTGFWIDARKAVAALSIGRNPEPFPAEARPARTVPCTGFMISKDMMMTAAHCLAGQLTLCRQTVAVFGYEVGDKEAHSRKCKAVVFSNGALDVTILKLGATDRSVTALPLQPAPPNVSDAAVVQHPRGSVMMVAETGCAIKRQPAPTIWNRARDLRDDLLDAGFEHTCDTDTGTSGAPVLAMGGLVGIHQGSVPGLNIGIRLQRILDCINIDTVAQTVTVRSPGETICINEAPQ